MAPALVDATILPGFDYARQTSVRITKRFDGHKMTVAFSAENAATVGTTPANVPSNISNNLAGLSATGTGILSNTTYSTNLAPDLVVKVAFDPEVGHYELKAIGRIFRDRLLATATVPGKINTLRAGALGAAAYIPFWRNRINYLLQGSWGAIARLRSRATLPFLILSPLRPALCSDVRLHRCAREQALRSEPICLVLRIETSQVGSRAGRQRHVLLLMSEICRRPPILL
jgi:hypothetical protein